MGQQVLLRRDTLERIKPPGMYLVVMHNDDYTTMDFVVELLKKVFHKNEGDASAIMLAVHTVGKAVVDAFTYDMAMTKKLQAEHLAAQQSFPLRLTVEPAQDRSVGL
jgi:ATP-dependent Clp protease adaptor protein ClpS